MYSSSRRFSSVASLAPVAAAPKTNEEDDDMLPSPKPEVVPDAIQETKHGETTGAELDGADTAASMPPVAPPQPAPSEPPVAAYSCNLCWRCSALTEPVFSM